jgi:hypothetical protein
MEYAPRILIWSAAFQFRFGSGNLLPENPAINRRNQSDNKLSHSKPKGCFVPGFL